MTTQDGYDWPNGVGDERWPAETKPKTLSELEEETVAPLVRALEMVHVRTPGLPTLPW